MSQDVNNWSLQKLHMNFYLFEDRSLIFGLIIGYMAVIGLWETRLFPGE